VVVDFEALRLSVLDDHRLCCKWPDPSKRHNGTHTANHGVDQRALADSGISQEADGQIAICEIDKFP